MRHSCHVKGLNLFAVNEMTKLMFKDNIFYDTPRCISSNMARVTSCRMAGQPLDIY